MGAGMGAAERRAGMGDRARRGAQTAERRAGWMVREGTGGMGKGAMGGRGGIIDLNHSVRDLCRNMLP